MFFVERSAGNIRLHRRELPQHDPLLQGQFPVIVCNKYFARCVALKTFQKLRLQLTSSFLW